MRRWSAALLGLLAAFLAAHARAADYYVCDCQPGAASGCKPGNDSSRGASPAEAKRSWRAARTLLANAACGDSVNLCVYCGQRCRDELGRYATGRCCWWCIDLLTLDPHSPFYRP